MPVPVEREIDLLPDEGRERLAGQTVDPISTNIVAVKFACNGLVAGSMDTSHSL